MESETANFAPSEKAARVRAMFGEIAPRYDFLNHALSMNIDRRWRRFVVGKVADRLQHPQALALDLCCGTGDLSLELAQLTETCGVDFCHPMLKIGLGKTAASPNAITIIEGDAMRVPFGDGVFDVVTMAFGLRNLENIAGGLREVLRLLKPGGRAAILEFSRPRLPIFRHLFQFYFMKILPRIGNAISGSSFAYQYLPESVQQFPDQQGLAAIMSEVGFSNVAYYNLFGGVAAVHLGER
jgi:demethylmenaquinone methyltransferase / 2-methoxy-6-polyprenyl-1,4-benzoquinol methylase